MLSRFESRKRVTLSHDALGGAEKALYKVVTWYLFWFLPVFRTYEMLTIPARLTTPSER